MAQTMFRSEDRAGLVGAVALHLLLVAVLAAQFAWNVADPVIPQRMTVSLATEVGLESTAPDPVAEARAAVAPTLSDNPAPPAPSEAVAPQPEIAPAPPPRPRPATTRTRTPPPPDTRDRRRPEESRARPEPARAAANTGGTRIGDNFLEGRGNSATSDDTRIPASQIGASAQASIIQAIVRQIRPHWNAPSGVDAEQLVTELAFDLNEDGSLKGRPRVIRQSGETESNRPQKALHAERAIRAVQLAAPFDLPDEYYNAWKSIRGARFDRNLSR